MNFRTIWNHPLRKPVVGGVIGLTTGLVVGFALGHRKLTQEIQEDLERIRSEMNELKTERLAKREEQLKEVRERWARQREQDAVVEVNGKYSSDNVQIEDIKVDSTGRRFIEERLQPTPALEVQAETPERRNIFAQSGEDWDYEEELKHRNPIEPYTLHKDEFFANESGYHQSTLTYYAGDNILADEQEVPIYGHESVVGNAMKFGHGSGQENVVYIRNDRLRGEYEVMLDESYYAVKVRGLSMDDVNEEEPIEHSAVIKKFRRE